MSLEKEAPAGGEGSGNAELGRTVNSTTGAKSNTEYHSEIDRTEESRLLKIERESVPLWLYARVDLAWMRPKAGQATVLQDLAKTIDLPDRTVCKVLAEKRLGIERDIKGDTIGADPDALMRVPALQAEIAQALTDHLGPLALADETIVAQVCAALHIRASDRPGLIASWRKAEPRYYRSLIR